MVSTEYSEAAVEALDILSHLEESEAIKIPPRVIEFLENNKSNTYKATICYDDNFEDLNIKEKTKEILAGIFLKYICPEQDKREVLNSIQKNAANYQEKIRNKYNIEDVFNKRKLNKIENSNSLMIIEKQNIFKIFLNKLLKIFK